MAVIQFNNSEDKGFTPLPEGVYDFQIMAVEQGMSSKGNPQLVIDTEVASGDSEGKKVKMWYSLTPQSAWKLKKLLIATHTPHEIQGDQISFDTEDLIDAVFCATATSGINPTNNKPKTDFGDERPSKLMEAPVAATVVAAPPAAALPAAPAAAAPATSAAEAPAGGFRRRSRQ